MRYKIRTLVAPDLLNSSTSTIIFVREFPYHVWKAILGLLKQRLEIILPQSSRLSGRLLE